MTESSVTTTWHPPAPPVWALWALRLAAAAGLALSLWLFWPVASGSAMPGCGTDPGFTCGSVLVSRWARWFGIPVSILAALLYATALVALVYVAPGRSSRQQAVAFKLLVALAIMAVGAGLWFMATMAGMRQACPYCLAAHGCGLLLAVLVGICARRRRRRRRRADARLSLASDPLLTVWGHLLLGFGGVVVLIVGQLLYVSPQVHASRIEGRPDTDTGPGPDRTVTFLSRRITLRAHDLPILGSPDAQHIIVSLSDYTCPSCRAQHQNLQRAHERYGDQLAIIQLPMPLDARCNRLVKDTADTHEGACYRAQIALALWRAQPESYAAFDAWMYAGEKPRSGAEVRKCMVDLIGEEAAQAARADPWPDRQIAESIEVFSTVDRVLGRTPAVPLLIVGATVLDGEAPTPARLFRLLERELGLIPPGRSASGFEEASP